MPDRLEQARQATAEAWTMGFLISLYKLKFKNFKGVEVDIEDYRKRISKFNENIFKVLVYEMEPEELNPVELARFKKLTKKS